MRHYSQECATYRVRSCVRIDNNIIARSHYARINPGTGKNDELITRDSKMRVRYRGPQTTTNKKYIKTSTNLHKYGILTNTRIYEPPRFHF